MLVKYINFIQKKQIDSKNAEFKSSVKPCCKH